MKTLSLVVFLVGVAGYVVLPYTLLTNFVALEYIFLGGGLVGVSHSLQLDDFDGQFFLLCVLAVAAAEAALGLALLVQFYRLRGNVQTLLYPFVKAFSLVIELQSFPLSLPMEEENFWSLVIGLTLIYAMGARTPSAGGPTPSAGDPTSGETPDPEDPDRWKRRLKKAAITVAVVVLVVGTGYLVYHNWDFIVRMGKPDLSKIPAVPTPTLPAVPTPPTAAPLTIIGNAVNDVFNQHLFKPEWLNGFVADNRGNLTLSEASVKKILKTGAEKWPKQILDETVRHFVKTKQPVTSDAAYNYAQDAFIQKMDRALYIFKKR